MSKLIATLLITLLWAADMAAQSGIYVGGHIRRERPNTVTKLKNSGFTYAILFNVNVETDGTLTTDGETICKDGVYVFANQQPHYVEDVEALKTWPTGIQRLEICIGGWGNESYYRIKDLINAQGTGSNTILYKNFKALKEALPWVEAVNNDDEHCYDVATAVKFHTMMYDLGYKTTVAPYMNKSFWQSLVSQLNNKRAGACDCVLIQCYGGGTYNNPSDWHLGNIPLHAGRENYQDGSSLDICIEKMQSWHDNNNVTGGFLWVYNDETWNLNKWASAMNRVFPSHKVENPVVTLYSEINYSGYAIQLPVGRYSMGELASYGITDKDIASYKMEPGYKMTAYINADLTGNKKEFTATEMERMGAMANRASSFLIEKVDEESGINELQNTTNKATACYDLQGRLLNGRPEKGLYVTKQGKYLIK
jgi:hypothetical protein